MLCRHDRAVGEFIIDAEMVIDLAVLRPGMDDPSTLTLRSFALACFAASRTRRTPGDSTATGFSIKTCFPA